MALFGSRQEMPPDMSYEPEPMQVSPNSLVDQVIRMRQQGMSNNQIIQQMTQQGYNYPDVFNALSQADMMTTRSAAGPIPQAPPAPQSQSRDSADSSREKIEEIAETIIEEKWDELVKNMNKVIEWKNKTDARIVQIEQQMKDMQASFDELHRAMIGKIGEYDKNIQNVGTELKAMGKVFEKVIPTLTENVNELSRITQNAKRK